jgi:chromosome segregation ATPase
MVNPQSRAAQLQDEISSRAKSLDERAAELRKETDSRRDAEYEVRRIQRRQTELEAAGSAVVETVREIRSELARANRPYRKVHALLVRIRRLLGSSPVKRATALDVAIDRLGQVEERVRAAIDGRSPPG